MRVSIIIPVYNVSAYIEKCVQSVMKQTMTSGVECILIDDLSTDNSIELAEKLIDDYTGNIKFTILKHTENRGVSASRNEGIHHATGDYIFFLDSDDHITPDCLATLYGLTIEYPGVEIVKGNVRSTQKDRDFSITRLVWLPEYSNDRAWLRLQFQLTRIPQSVWNMLISRQFITANNLYFIDGAIFEDWHWYHFAGKYIASMAFTKKITYFYTINPTSLIATHYQKKLDVRSICMVINDMLERIDSHATRYEMKGILAASHRMGNNTGIMGGNFFKLNPIYRNKYFRRMYDAYRYINKHGRRSFKGVLTYFMFEIYLFYVCVRLKKGKQ